MKKGVEKSGGKGERIVVELPKETELMKRNLYQKELVFEIRDF